MCKQKHIEDFGHFQAGLVHGINNTTNNNNNNKVNWCDVDKSTRKGLFYAIISVNTSLSLGKTKVLLLVESIHSSLMNIVT